MPTPDDDTTAPSTPPVEATSSRASFTSCPPEEEREAHAPREARASATIIRSADHAILRAAEDEHAITQEPMPVSDTAKREETEDAGLVSGDSSSPEPISDSDVRSATHQPPAAIPRAPYDDRGAKYLELPPLPRHNLHSNSTTSFLKPGSKFRGTQQSDRQVYDVQVEIKDVDLAESFICGYLRIQGLTDDHPTLTTFFEGEIIGPKYLFRTSHPSWNSSEKIDLQHWARFPAWRPLAKSAKNNPSFTLKNYLEREHLFMRWKEYFLVPDHRVKSISGASFEGFYYICFDQRAGSVSGIYFHAKSEKYQQLELRHVDDGGRAGAVEFR